jgi:sec-independent protein translocase protein TatA
MGRLGFGELLVLLAIVLLVVGAKRLPQLARSLGEAMREFQRAMKGEQKGERKDDER